MQPNISKALLHVVIGGQWDLLGAFRKRKVKSLSRAATSTEHTLPGHEDFRDFRLRLSSSKSQEGCRHRYVCIFSRLGKNSPFQAPQLWS